MRKLILIFLLISLGNAVIAQDLGLSLLVKTSKYKEIVDSYGYSLDYYNILKEMEEQE